MPINQINPYEAMQARLRVAAELYGLDDALFKVFMATNRSMIVSLPVLMDNGQWEVFTGFRVQHSTARGPAKGGAQSRSRCRVRNAGRRERQEISGGGSKAELLRCGPPRHSIRCKRSRQSNEQPVQPPLAAT